MYLTHTEYLAYGGSVTVSAYPRLEFKARKAIDQKTFGRLKNETVISEPVKRLMFELVNTIRNLDTEGIDYQPLVASESNDGYSISFHSGSIMTIEQKQKIISNMIDEYLADEVDSNGTPLLYCGAL